MEIKRGTPRPAKTRVYRSSKLNTFKHDVEDVDPAKESPGIRLLAQAGWTFERITRSGGVFTHFGVDNRINLVGTYTEINTNPDDPDLLEAGTQFTFPGMGRITSKHTERKRIPTEPPLDPDLDTYVALYKKTRFYKSPPKESITSKEVVEGLMDKPKLWDWFTSKIKDQAVTSHLQPRVLIEKTPEGTLVSLTYLLATGNWDSEYMTTQLRKFFS